MNKNVLIVNFNTQMLTEACIKSVNKFSPGCKIYVFDNSDKEPFINIFDNVTVLDNTEGQIVDFKKVLDRHKDFINKGATDNDYGSFKHCLSIDAAMDIIQDGFVLMDSDILIKKDFTPLFDERKVYVGSIERISHFKPRVAPFLCYINVKMCKENGIRYFDEDHMFGFYDAHGGKNYDTGCWFYEACQNLPKTEININQYMIHFRAGTWYKDAVEKQNYKKFSPERWLEIYRRYWNDTKPTPVVMRKKITETRKGAEEIIENPAEVENKKDEMPGLKKTTIEDSKKVVIKRPVRKRQTEHATLVSQIKKSTLTGRKIALIKK